MSGDLIEECTRVVDCTGCRHDEKGQRGRWWITSKTGCEEERVIVAGRRGGTRSEEKDGRGERSDEEKTNPAECVEIEGCNVPGD